MRLLCLLAVAFAARLTAQEAAWDAPLLPIYEAHVILRMECEKAREVPWSPALARVAHGLEPHERVWMIMPDAAVAMTLGDPTCVVGEDCGGAWVGLALSPKATRNAIAVVPRRLLGDADPVTAPWPIETRHGSCNEPPRLSWTPAECTEWDLGWRHVRLEVQTEKKAIEETGWELIRTHVRVTSRDPDSAVKKRDWQMVSEGVEELTPRAVLPSASMCRVLWRKDEGITGPALITLQMSRVAPDGAHVFGRKYTAGGQPCD
jgi:hypothetical protein